ncbi:MAG: hypothetical protein ACOCUR_00335 [Nanoarchaeota archaeon]
MSATSAKFFVILLAVIGVGLLLTVGSNIVTIYRGSIGDSEPEKEVHYNVNCQQMLFDVWFSSADELSVKNTDLSSYNLNVTTLVDASSGEEKVFDHYLFVKGMTRTIDISDFNSDLFYFFPYDCHNIAKVCNRTSLDCEDPTAYNG